MPVRIYDISKKLGLENKEVLSKAKELGIAAARVASSSLDKITAEYLEQQILLARPDLVAPPAPAPQPPKEPSFPAAPPPPEVQAVQKQESATETATALLEPETAPPNDAPAPLSGVEAPAAISQLPPEPDLLPEPVAKAPPP